ncbi:MAG: PHB depolymerase family esterase [Pseudomonadota bacterium]
MNTFAKRERIGWIALPLLLTALTACSGGGGASSETLPPAPAPAAPADLCSGTSTTLDCGFEHDTIAREFILYRPSSAGPNAALLLNFHGYGSSARGQFQYADFRALADRDGFMIASPQGTELDGTTHWAVGSWTAASTVDDVGFTAALIDAVDAEYGVDTKRVYATGMSNGGYMSYHLACQLSDRIAAIASVTGSLSPEVRAACSPTRPMPVLQIHGTADDVVPFDGANWTLSMADVMSYWQDANGCAAAPETVALDDANGDGAIPGLDRYQNCTAGADVQLYRMTNMGHIWPELTRGDDIAGVEIVWAFLSRFSI